MVGAEDRNDDENNEGLASLIHPVPDINSKKAREAKRVYIQGVTGPARRSTKGGWTEKESQCQRNILMLQRGSKQAKKRSRGRIILLSSPNFASYSASKAAVETMAKELKLTGITVNCVAPGSVAMDMLFFRRSQDDIIGLIEACPTGRLGATMDVTKIFGFLASDDSEWINLGFSPSEAKCVPNRTAVQCLHRWQKVLNPNLVKGLWTKEEDDLIIQIVGKQGNKKWSDIAKHLPGRIGKQCRERWHNHLNPDTKRTAWTKEEELVLINAHNTYGNKWAEIAKLLPGRTENSVKNHWNCSISKKIIQSACNFNMYMKVENGNCSDSEAAQQNFDQRINVESKRRPITRSLDLVLGNAGAKESHLPTSDNRILRTESSNTEHAIAIPLAPEDLNLGFLSYKPLIQLQDLGTDDSDRYPTSIQNTSSSITPPRSRSEGISSPCQSIISRLRSAARSFKLPSIILQRQNNE